ncbi:unnamed protein product [Coffea canephora]|uniref:Uncharacterized protein n=1 Tax=Coffea canephora TaxID=49390 RepID=A0A068UAC5_COFCA|nr:unnamed protein product [Coffea canephora]
MVIHSDQRPTLYFLLLFLENSLSPSLQFCQVELKPASLLKQTIQQRLWISISASLKQTVQQISQASSRSSTPTFICRANFFSGLIEDHSIINIED